jgi:hypothetical protein
MARVVIKCHVTGETVPTGFDADANSWNSRQLGDNRAPCPACKQTHAWTKSDAWLEQNEVSPPKTTSGGDDQRQI